MNGRENAAAQAEALKAAGHEKDMSSAERARLWAGLNRYLAAEAEHIHAESEHEKASEDTSDEK